MYRNIAVAFDKSSEAFRALAAGIQLAKTLGVGLQTITVMEKLPEYTAFATATDGDVIRILEEDRRRFYEELQGRARAAGRAEGVEVEPHTVDGECVDSIVQFVCDQKIDLLVIGLHKRQNRLTRLWSTVYAIAQNVPCSLLGVH